MKTLLSTVVLLATVALTSATDLVPGRWLALTRLDGVLVGASNIRVKNDQTFAGKGLLFPLPAPVNTTKPFPYRVAEGVSDDAGVRFKIKTSFGDFPALVTGVNTKGVVWSATGVVGLPVGDVPVSLGARKVGANFPGAGVYFGEIADPVSGAPLKVMIVIATDGRIDASVGVRRLHGQVVEGRLSASGGATLKLVGRVAANRLSVNGTITLDTTPVSFSTPYLQ